MLALGAAVCVYNLPQLIAGSVQYDGLEVHYAAQRYLSDELHAGRIPFWTPYIFSGFPFLADLQVGAWYPLNWLFFLAGITPRSIGLELLLHNLIGALGAYLLARCLNLTPVAAVLTAMFYALSGWFAAHSQHVGMFDTASWLPWLLLLLLRLENAISPVKAMCAALLGAGILLPGSFPIALYTFAFVGLWCLRSWRRLVGLALAGIWGSLLAAVMILPALELVMHSVRVQLNAVDLPDIGYFHPGSLLTLVYPDYYGLLSGHYVGPGDSTQYFFYAGIALTPLALLGAVRNPRVLRMALLLGAPFVAYAGGPRAGVYNLVAQLPGFRSVELPMHGWFLVALGLALLGGAGAVVVERRIGGRWTAALCGFVLIDVLVFNQLLNPLAYARTPVDPPARFAGVQRIYGRPLAQVGYRNHGLQSRVETTYGYNPLELSAYAEYAEAAQTNQRLIDGFAAPYSLVSERGDLEPNPDAVPLASFPDDATATALIVGRDEQALIVTYASSVPNLLRVAIPMYPGWSATLGGTPLPLETVDQAFIGIDVPPGQGDIRLSYAPRLFGLGAAISALALLALALSRTIIGRCSGSSSRLRWFSRKPTPARS